MILIDMALYLFLLVLAAQALAHFAYRAWKYRFYPGFGVFCISQVALVVWILCYVGEQTDPVFQKWWFLAKFAAIGAVAPSWFLFTLVFTKTWTRGLGWWYLVYLWALVLPFITLTNDTHHLFFRELVQKNEMVGLNAPLFTVHVAINYSLMIPTTVLFVAYWFRAPERRKTTAALLCAGLIPWIASIANEFTKDPVGGATIIPVNPTLPAFVASALIFAWVIFAQRLLDPRPLARERLFNVLQEGVLVLDAEGRVVDSNESAKKLLSPQGGKLLGLKLDEAGTPLKNVARARLLDQNLDEPWEIDVERDGQNLHFDIRLIALRSGEQKHAGWLLTIRDIGARRNLLRMEEMGLSAREQELVEWVNQGLSNKEIAVLLDIGTATVKNHLYNIFRKCGANSRQELLRVLRGKA